MPQGKALFSSFEYDTLQKSGLGYAIAGFPAGGDSTNLLASVKEILLKELTNSFSGELIEAAKAIPEEEGSKLVGPPGSERPAFALTNFASMHTMYHDAQLNFIQSLHGDLDMHWS